MRAVKFYIGQLDIPLKLKVIIKSSKSCIYKLLNYKSITAKSHIKYANEGFIIDDKEWKKYIIVCHLNI